MRRGVWLGIGLALSGLALVGCRGGDRVSPESLVARTREALSDVLVGPPPEMRGSATAPLDPPLLKRGVHERVRLAVDEPAFLKLGRGAFSEAEVRDMEKQVIEATDRHLRRYGFSLGPSPFPPPPPDDDATLLAVIAPLEQVVGSPTERSGGRRRALVMVRLTVTDRTGVVLAQRDFYSGRDVGK